ncbi:MAG: sensor histidine kinase [Bacteroidota bacterium]
MGLKRNILLKRTVIISLVAFSVLITTGIALIYRSSIKRDKHYIRFVSLAADVESEILKTRINMDEILFENDRGYANELEDRLGSLRLLLTELHSLIYKNYERYATHRDVFDFNAQFDTIISQLNKIEEKIHTGNKDSIPNIGTDLLKTFNEFNIYYKEYESNLPKLLLMDNSSYKLEFLAIVVLNLIFILLAGYLINRLINRLIMADRNIVKKTIDVEKRERERIAADLHDGLGAILSGLIIHIQVMEKEYRDNPHLNEQLKYLNSLSKDAIKSIEDAINNLNPSQLSKYGLIKSLQKIIDKINQLGKTQFLVDAENLDLNFQESSELLLFRICNELINNALKHSEAENAVFSFYNFKKEFHLHYKDDGIGFSMDSLSPENEQGGLYNLIRRVESMEGTFRIDSEPGKGVEIEIILNLA